jgi:hypothetical protein
MIWVQDIKEEVGTIKIRRDVFPDRNGHIWYKRPLYGQRKEDGRRDIAKIV